MLQGHHVPGMAKKKVSGAGRKGGNINLLTYRFFNRNEEKIGSQLETTKSLWKALSFMSKYYFEQ